jgi:hypothetical protein
MKNGIKAIALLFVLVFCAAESRAELITISLSATVNYVEDIGNKLEGKIIAGSTITGSYTYEPTTPDSSPSDPTQGNYWHYASPAGIFLTIGGFNFGTNPDNVNFLVSIGNNASEQDNYLVRSYYNLPLSNGTLVGTIDWQLDDHTATALSSDALPVTKPVLGQWQTNALSIYGVEAGDDFFIDADVTSVQLVPEPATFLLLTAGVLILKRRTNIS